MTRSAPLQRFAQCKKARRVVGPCHAAADGSRSQDQVMREAERRWESQVRVSSQILTAACRRLTVCCSLQQPAKTLALSFLLHQPAYAHQVLASVTACSVSMPNLYQILFTFLTILWGCRSGRARSKMLHAKQQASSCRQAVLLLAEVFAAPMQEGSAA